MIFLSKHQRIQLSLNLSFWILKRVKEASIITILSFLLFSIGDLVVYELRKCFRILRCAHMLITKQNTTCIYTNYSMLTCNN